MKIIDQAYLELVDPRVNSAKFYTAAVVEEADATCGVAVVYGRIDTAGQLIWKTRAATLPAAQTAFDKVVSEKHAKGYTYESPDTFDMLARLGEQGE